MKQGAERVLLRRLRRARRTRASFSLLREFSWAGGAAGLALSSSLLAAKAGAGPWPLRVLWLAAALVFLAILWRGVRSLLKEKRAATAFSLALPGLPADFFLTAWELAERAETASSAFCRRAEAQAVERFPGDWRTRVRPREWGNAAVCLLAGGAALLGATAVVPFASPSGRRALWPFGETFPPGLVSVRPGDSLFPRGGDVTIFARISPQAGIPLLHVRAEGSAWAARPMSGGDDGFSAFLGSLQETLDYKVELDGRLTRVYRLTPFDPPKLIRARATVTPPEYAGRASEPMEDMLSVRALAGSRVRWDVSLDPADCPLRLEGEGAPVPVWKDGSWSWEEPAGARRRLWAGGMAQGTEVLLGELAVEIAPDDPPLVSVLSPSGDARAGPAEKIPVTLEIEDDLGPARAELRTRINGGKWKKLFSWSFFRGTARPTPAETVLDLGALGVRPGDQVEIQAHAWDRRPILGTAGADSRAGKSEIRRIGVVSYDADHAAVEKSLNEFQGELLKRLGEQRTLREGLSVSSPTYSGLLSEQLSLGRRIATNAEELADLLARMASDPGTDRGALAEHRGVSKNMSDLIEETLPRASEALAHRDQENAVRAMDDIARELERLSRLSERALRAQNTRRLLRDQGELSNLAENLAKSLADGPPEMSEAEAEEFRAIGREMAEAMQRIRERLEKMPKALSEEFMERADVETLRFDQVGKALADLARSLSARDGAGAVEAAREALARLKEIENQLSRAGAGGLGEGLAGPGPEAEGALNEADGKLKDLIKRQEELLSKTEGLAREASTVRLAGQDKGLEGLAQAAAGWQALADSSARDLDPVNEEAREAGLRLLSLEILAGDIRRALAANQPLAAISRLEEIPGRAEAAAASLFQAAELLKARSPGTGGAESSQKIYNHLVSAGDKISALAEEARAIEVSLGGPESDQDFLSEESLRTVASWPVEQRLISGDSLALAELLRDPSRRTALLAASLIRRLTAASETMEAAAEELTAVRLRPAQESEERALALLREAQDSLSDAQRQLQSLAGSASQGAAPTLQQISPAGTSPGPTLLPRPEDFRPPREFRREMIDSMKEPYPKDHESIIQDYYRHWAK